jgi:chromosome segregation ATPase
MSLHLAPKLGHLTRKSDEAVNNLNGYWNAKDSNRKNLGSLREDRMKEDKEIDAIEFDLAKGEYKLDQAERRLRVVASDLEELDHQLEQLEALGVFPDSIWSIKDI